MVYYGEATEITDVIHFVSRFDTGMAVSNGFKIARGFYADEEKALEMFEAHILCLPIR